MSNISAARQAQLLEATNLLLDGRRTGASLTELPADLRPLDLEEVYLIQDNLAEAYGPIGGYKIGAPTPEAAPTFAPMPQAWIAPGGAELSGSRWRYRGLEAEIAFQLGADLPPRATPYPDDEVFSAVSSCHPVIEVLESAFTDPVQTDRLSSLADLQMHGGLIFGPPCPDWSHIDWNTETVVLAVDGTIRVERTGSNTSGNLLKLLPWLANHGAARTGGLHAGQWITTGSWTGNTLAMAGSSVDVTFTRAGRVTLHFAPEAKL